MLCARVNENRTNTEPSQPPETPLPATHSIAGFTQASDRSRRNKTKLSAASNPLFTHLLIRGGAVGVVEGDDEVIITVPCQVGVNGVPRLVHAGGARPVPVSACVPVSTVIVPRRRGSA